ncbi:MAG: GAF domain-containing sensor histidine kinase [Chloroflexi bacterium]|nr:GAF domain-containing sensor histidine kinase [Chloroflexota bacterium]
MLADARPDTTPAEFQRIEAALQRRLELEALTNQISTRFINLRDEQIDDGIQHSLQMLGEFAGADRCFIGLYTDDGQWMNGAYEWCADGIPAQRSRIQNISIEAFPWFNLRTLRRETVIYRRGTADLPPEAAAEQQEFDCEGIWALVTAPLESQGQVIGFIGFSTHSRPDDWTAEALDLLNMVTGIFASVLERRRFQAIQAGHRRFLELLAAESTLTETLHILVRIAEEQSPGMQGLILLLNGRRLYLGASVSLPAAYAAALEGLKIGPAVGSCGTAAYLRQRVVVEDIAEDSRWDGQRDLALRHHLRACWSEPVFSSAGHVLGTFAMYYRHPRAPTETELQTLQTAAHLAGVAIEHKRAQDALRRANLELEQRVEERTYELERRKQIAESLRSTIAIINSSRSLKDILDFIVTQARDLLHADACVLHSMDMENESATLEASCGWPDELAETQPISLAAPGSFPHRETMLMRRVSFSNYPPGYAEAALNDPLLDPKTRARQALIRTRYAGSLALPLVIKDELFGSLIFYYRTPQEFPHEQVEIAATFAEQAALAIENTRLRERVERSAAEAERGRLARDLHDSVTQTLFSASLIAEVVPRVWKDDPAEGGSLLEQVRLLTRGALAEMRTLLLELRPAALLQAELADSLRHLVDAAAARAGFPVRLSVIGREPLPTDVKVVFYRIAQEALNNTAKHAEASAATVTLDGQAGYAELRICDDGRGFDVRSVSPTRLGLGIMAERAQAIGAALTIESQPGRGTLIVARWENKGSQ